MMKDKEEKETLMLPVPMVNGVGYFDHKDECCVALATHEEGFHIAFEFGDHIVAVECLPQNYPAIDVVGTRNERTGSIRSRLWRGSSRACGTKIIHVPRPVRQNWQPSRPIRKAGWGRKPNRLFHHHKGETLRDACSRRRVRKNGGERICRA